MGLLSDAIVEVKNLKKYFKTPKGTIHAVDGVNFQIKRGTTFGVVGESGCGKSTLGRVIVRLLKPTDGRVIFNDQDITDAKKKKLKTYHKDMQMIFQDPFSSLDPRMSVSQTIGEPLIRHKLYSNKADMNKRVYELMEMVGLARRFESSYPHELDGGRRQRIGVARAIALKPEFIVCDEPVSALDVSIQAQILNLMMDLQEEMKLTYMFITHDLSVVKHISDEICVMYLGHLVEKAPSGKLFERPLHPYSKALLSAIPVPTLGNKPKRVLLKGEISTPLGGMPGCRFASRCNYSKEICYNEQPPFIMLEENHYVACHLAADLNWTS